MKKIILAVALAICAAAAVQAQTFSHRDIFMSVEAAGNMGSYSISDSAYDTGFKPGWTGGFNMEAHLGDLQQYAMIISGKFGPHNGTWSVADVEYQASYFTIGAYFGFRYLFRNKMFLEIMPGMDLPFSHKVKTPDGTVIKRQDSDPVDEDIFAFSVYGGVGYYINDFMTVFFRANKGFTDMFRNDRYNPTAIKETPVRFELGMSFGIGI